MGAQSSREASIQSQQALFGYCLLIHMLADSQANKIKLWITSSIDLLISFQASKMVHPWQAQAKSVQSPL
ncbi:hypothetical protein DLR72_10975 [Vibrio paracholerae]|uniref:Uncharacterized protein n=1 Tax=Vibrio paracholerae TaxID=650003 RepID=A0ABD7G2U3_9VIBR|nr:hypothetical protein DLR72_10975 [Vibrio paracholerae]